MMHLTAKDIQMAKDTHVTAPTRFVEAGGIRYAYRRFGAETGTPLVFQRGSVMILGLSISTFTSVHVALSLIGIVSGVIVLYGMVRATRLDGWTGLFLATTVLTSVTAFFFPSTSFGPAHVVGVLSLVGLAAAIVALYFFRLAGPWRWIYIVGAVLALYLNVFVAVVQAFQKLPPLAALAPTQSEPPFLIAQLVVVAIFIVLGVVAVKRFHA